MRRNFKAAALILPAAMVLAASFAGAQTFTTLYHFEGKADGGNPLAALMLDPAGNLNGAASQGGVSGFGTLFRLRPDGSGFTVLHSFADGGLNGAYPYRALIMDSAGNLYGDTYGGGASNIGTVFKLSADTGKLSVLYDCGNPPGCRYPMSVLLLDSSGTLYGTAVDGGNIKYPAGAVFKLQITDVIKKFTLLHTFQVTDGSHPTDGLVMDSTGTLYGTTRDGSAGYGNVFKISPDDTGFAELHQFTGGDDGSYPQSLLILDADGNLYGTASGVTVGGSGTSTVFKLRTDGSNFTVLHRFNSDGSEGLFPGGALLQDARGNLYGTAQVGDINRLGTVFTLRTDGTGFRLLHEFATLDGQHPISGLTRDAAGNLYGTTVKGGSYNRGTVFKVSPAPLYKVCLLYDPTKAVKSGATIPIKLQLCDASGNNLSSPNITLHATGVTQVSTLISGAVEDAGNADPDNDFRFDSTLGSTGGYIFNLKTTELTTGSYNLKFTVTDDALSTYAAPFQVK